MKKLNKAQRIMNEIAANPTASNPAIAAKVGCDIGYVWSIRRKAVVPFPFPHRTMAEVAADAPAPEPQVTHDIVNSPSHYTDGGIETIDYIQAKLSPEEFRGYCLGNAFKYLSRAGKKGDATVDLKKAQWYIDRITTKD
jgi:hypothetical protein